MNISYLPLYLLIGAVVTLAVVVVLSWVTRYRPQHAARIAPEPFWPFADDPRFGSMILADEVPLSPGGVRERMRYELAHDEEWRPVPASRVIVDVSWWPQEHPGPGAPVDREPGPGPAPRIGETHVEALLREMRYSDGPRAWFAGQVAA